MDPINNTAKDFNLLSLSKNNGDVIKRYKTIKHDFGCKKITDLKEKINRCRLSDQDLTDVIKGMRLIEKNIQKIYRNEKPWYTNILDRFFPMRDGAKKRNDEIRNLKSELHVFINKTTHQILLRKLENKEEFRFLVFLIEDENIKNQSKNIFSCVRNSALTRERKLEGIRENFNLLYNDYQNSAENHLIPVSFPDTAKMDLYMALLIKGREEMSDSDYHNFVNWINKINTDTKWQDAHVKDTYGYTFSRLYESLQAVEQIER